MIFFLFQVIFSLLCFWGTVICADEFEARETTKETEIKTNIILLSWLEIICGSQSFVSLTITDGKHDR